MTAVTVIVPWRGGCVHRERAWAWIEQQYIAEHPDWAILPAECPTDVWSKGAAVAQALELTNSPVIVVADADVWCEGLHHAVTQVADRGGWAIPHETVHRLTETATQRVLLDGVFAGPTIEAPSRGVAGGGIVVITREAITAVPLDPRFEGWGCEDTSWGYALVTLIGKPWRFKYDLWHLWHPPQPRRDRRHGSIANENLRRRYLRAERIKPSMRKLIKEVTNGATSTV